MIKPRSRLLPTPMLSVLLLIVWLMLQNSVAPGQILLGAVLAIAIPILTYRFWEPQPDLQKPWRLISYFLRVIMDIIIANLQVSYLILNPRAKFRPAFVRYPLELEEKFPITVLSSTITLTPGTVSAYLTLDGRHLIIHALDVEDEQELIDEIRQRYERPLKEIFEC
ncbi:MULTISPECIES: Na+/H+ antiporter subunit E [unclassified Cobetia]|uniref:Na+/H+ antiporter subunit E n=1 Tax=unclassified Cobetia TaxID=2609414 RepID=UPI00159E1680|nr:MULTISPECIES: Na+/H+ antiporter subunit E [unclassified Cobetia]MCO7232496.1 Na+/H+ antiporter subunit E [Cobetia sp. Dlab-2-AX]MCO7235770.1 Na+/H+ antiporter subunit E [Cobetia sp. Dlab-2-U]NVN54536.1 Na+/H+ antiporter subunit E [bacterium Scap17]